jgi:hypothetical protein
VLKKSEFTVIFSVRTHLSYLLKIHKIIELNNLFHYLFVVAVVQKKVFLCDIINQSINIYEPSFLSLNVRVSFYVVISKC